MDHDSLLSGRVDERAELLSYELTRGGQGSAILTAGGRAMYCTAPGNTSSLTSRRTLKLYAQPRPLGMRVPTGRYWVMYGVNCFSFLLYATVYFPIYNLQSVSAPAWLGSGRGYMYGGKRVGVPKPGRRTTCTSMSRSGDFPILRPTCFLVWAISVRLCFPPGHGLGLHFSRNRPLCWCSPWLEEARRRGANDSICY